MMMLRKENESLKQEIRSLKDRNQSLNLELDQAVSN